MSFKEFNRAQEALRQRAALARGERAETEARRRLKTPAGFLAKVTKGIKCRRKTKTLKLRRRTEGNVATGAGRIQQWEGVDDVVMGCR